MNGVIDNHMWQLVYDAFEDIADYANYQSKGASKKEVILPQVVRMCHEQMRLLRDVYDLKEKNDK